MKTAIGDAAPRNSARNSAFLAHFSPIVAAIVLAFSAAALPVFAQEKIAPPLATGFDSIKAEALRTDLTFLASDALQGRMSL
jgi:hypothetical protein